MFVGLLGWVDSEEDGSAEVGEEDEVSPPEGALVVASLLTLSSRLFRRRLFFPILCVIDLFLQDD